MKYERFRTIDNRIYSLDVDSLELLDCTHGYFYVNSFHFDEKSPARHRKNKDLYYEILGTIVRKDKDEWQAVTHNLAKNSLSRKNAAGKMAVFVPDDMDEWLGYWDEKHKTWIYVELLRPEDMIDNDLPITGYRPGLPQPSMDVSFVHFAENYQGIFVIQAFRADGTPVFLSQEEKNTEFPFPLLPRFQFRNGNTYVFDENSYSMILD
jgi:allantoicase